MITNSPRFPWQRYWYPVDSDWSLESDGFPADPEEEFAAYYPSRPQPLAAYADEAVLVLLGEPGIGKSTALREECERLEKAGATVMYRELNQYQSDTGLIEGVFRAPELLAWRDNPAAPLVLLLDSLDECRLAIPRAVRVIAGQLEELPRERLQFRITCRVADWPEEMTGKLNELWPVPQGGEAPHPRCLSLMPLRRSDVALAARTSDIDADTFLAEIRRVGVASFASHPHALTMLLNIFKERGSLPSRRADIFELGCLHLVSENSASRIGDGHRGEIEGVLRLPIAARIAALLLLSRNSAVLREERHPPEAGALSIADLLGGEESANGLTQRVDAQAVREVLDTTLFGGSGPQRLGFTHQSHMEFLAAWYLKKARKLDAPRLLRLLRAADARVPPQLGELAAWLAEMDGDVFAALLDDDPLLLLRSDGAALNDEQKARLTQSLLGAFLRREASDWDWNLRKHYPKLNYPGLAESLKRIILDTALPEIARESAMEIAAANRLGELSDILADLALDGREPQRIREEAAKSVVSIGGSEGLGKLRPLVFEPEFQSLLASALWPGHLSTEEIFGFITASKSLAVLDIKRYDLDRWVKQFNVEDMQVALTWLEEDYWLLANLYFQGLKQALMTQGWKMFQNEPGIRRSFAKAAWACWRHDNSIFDKDEMFHDDQPVESSVGVEELFSLLLEQAEAIDNQISVSFLAEGLREFLSGEDAPSLLLDIYPSAATLAHQRLVARCFGDCMDYQCSPALLEKMVEASGADQSLDSPLAEVINSWLQPWNFDEEFVKGIRERRSRRRESKPPLNPPPAQRVENALVEFEAGRQDAWMVLWQELNLADDAVGYSWRGSQIVDMPGWARLDVLGKLRVRRCALAWLESQVMTNADLYLDNQYSDHHIATCLALGLLLNTDKDALRQFPKARWKEWAPAILRYHFGSNSGIRESLLRFAFEQAPDTVVGALRRELERELTREGPLTLGFEINLLWYSKISALLHELRVRDDLKPEHRETLLGYLLAHGDCAAEGEALRRFATASGDEALRYAALLLEHLTPEFWLVLWARMEADQVFGSDFMLGAAYYGYPFLFLDLLDERQLAQLYVWLETQFPQAEDIPHPEGVFTPTSRDDVAHLRGNCIGQLANRGTAAAINELSDLTHRFPTYNWLWHNLAQAREKARELAWQAVPPRELLEFVQRGDGRLVRNAAEFAEAVMASLERLQAKLNENEHPLAPFLWNLDADEKRGRPKSEDRMSDFVLHHLRDDLPALLVNREVQVQNLNETGIGERADLKLETLDGAGNRLTLIIESKEGWNTELLTAMKAQLHDRYMRQTGAIAGIYLVGWFAGVRWVDCDKKKAGARHGSLEQLRDKLAAQAANLPGVKVCVLDVCY